MRAGLLGGGDVAHYYLDGLADSRLVEVAAVADRDPARGIPPEQLLADPSIELVVNLTPAAAHAETTRAALEAGKHVFSEKPLAMALAEGEELAALARERRLGLAVAPDTFLGPSLRTARALLDAGELGEPVGAAASFTAPGSDLWHPNPEHLFAAGPIYDEGVYFLTALVALYGSIASVSAMASYRRPERTIATGPRAGERFTAAAPTHWVGTLEFANGALGTLTLSFAVRGTTAPALELQGDAATLRMPFPGFYDGPLRLGRAHDGPWVEIEPEGPPLGRIRGPGVEDLVEALRDGRPPRCSPELALHVLDAMEALVRSAASGSRERLRTTVPSLDP